MKIDNSHILLSVPSQAPKLRIKKRERKEKEGNIDLSNTKFNFYSFRETVQTCTEIYIFITDNAKE